MKWESAREIVEEHIDKEVPSMPPNKVFRSKYSLPELKCYKSKPDQEYWEKWPSMSWDKAQDMKSSIIPELLNKLLNQDF